MNKMNLREFAEVMAALVNNAGVSCIIDNNAPDGQLRFAASKGNTTVYTDVSSLWNQCSETGADLQQLAMAIAEALKQALGEAEKEARFQPRQKAAEPRRQTPVNNEDKFKALTRAVEEMVKRKAMQQKMTGGEENLDAFLASLYGNKNHSCGCNCGCGHFEPEEKQEEPESEGYDPMNDLPDGLRKAIGGLLKKINEKAAREMQRQAKPAAEPSEEEIIKNMMFENVLPMIVTAEALDSAIRFNNKENQNKYETRRIKLTELEKDRSWQQFRSDSILEKKYREFKNILDELKKNKEKPHDKYDRGFINGSLRMLTNLQNLVTEVANFVNDAIDYFLPKEQKDENNKSEKREKKVSKKISPFYKIMEEAYWEKGFVESFSYEAGMITPEQAENLFTTDIAYIKSLDKEQQEKMFGVYADGLMTAMKDERISANTKALYQTFIAKYENGEYDKQISDIIDEGVDWTGIYSDKNEGLVKSNRCSI